MFIGDIYWVCFLQGTGRKQKLPADSDIHFTFSAFLKSSTNQMLYFLKSHFGASLF